MKLNSQKPASVDYDVTSQLWSHNSD